MQVLADLPADSLGAYVISMARTSSDVLAVILLQVTLEQKMKKKSQHSDVLAVILLQVRCCHTMVADPAFMASSLVAQGLPARGFVCLMPCLLASIEPVHVYCCHVCC